MRVTNASGSGGANTTMVELSIEVMDVENAENGGGATAGGYGATEPNEVIVLGSGQDGGGNTVNGGTKTDEMVVLGSGHDGGGDHVNGGMKWLY